MGGGSGGGGGGGGGRERELGPVVADPHAALVPPGGELGPQGREHPQGGLAGGDGVCCGGGGGRGGGGGGGRGARGRRRSPFPSSLCRRPSPLPVAPSARPPLRRVPARGDVENAPVSRARKGVRGALRDRLGRGAARGRRGQGQRRGRGDVSDPAPSASSSAADPAPAALPVFRVIPTDHDERREGISEPAGGRGRVLAEAGEPRV